MRFAGKIGYVKTVQDPQDDSLWKTETVEKLVEVCDEVVDSAVVEVVETVV